jgi:hypothetical protein
MLLPSEGSIGLPALDQDLKRLAAAQSALVHFLAAIDPPLEASAAPF